MGHFKGVMISSERSKWHKLNMFNPWFTLELLASFFVWCVKRYLLINESSSKMAFDVSIDNRLEVFEPSFLQVTEDRNLKIK